MPTFTDDPVVSVSESADTPAVLGDGSGYEGVRGVSHDAHGGVVGINVWDPVGAPPGTGGNGGWFESSQGEGVRGWAKTPHHGGVVGVNTAGGFGVYGKSDDNSAVVGESQTGVGVFGRSNGTAVWGESTTWVGVYGQSDSTTGGSGVWGEHKGQGAGVVGKSASGAGVWATSDTSEAMHAETHSPTTAAIAAYNLNPDGTGAAIFGKKEGSKGFAGFFDGNVWVSGVLNVGKDITLANADCAEDFNIGAHASVEPGTVMVLGEAGALFPSQLAYDKRVAGVISGAGRYKPGIVLDRQPSDCVRQPVALLGKVYCKVDAQYGAIEVGDLLTTSQTQGHAMRADSPAKAFGAVIGKALRSLPKGRGLIPILIALQ